MRFRLLAILTLWVSLPAWGQALPPEDAPARDYGALVARLADPDPAVRAEAHYALLADNTLDVAALAPLIRDAQAYEQRYRLIQIAQHHFLREMREREFGEGAELQQIDPRWQEEAFGAVGFTYDLLTARDNAFADRAGVVVIETLPGFPGHAHLRPGDIILAINLRNLPNTSSDELMFGNLNSMISSQDPGSVINVTLIRDGQQQIVPIVCAQGLALRLMVTTDALKAYVLTGPYARAWDEVYQQLIQDLPERTPLTLAE